MRASPSNLILLLLLVLMTVRVVLFVIISYMQSICFSFSLPWSHAFCCLGYFSLRSICVILFFCSVLFLGLRLSLSQILKFALTVLDLICFKKSKVHDILYTVLSTIGNCLKAYHKETKNYNKYFGNASHNMLFVLLYFYLLFF